MIMMNLRIIYGITFSLAGLVIALVAAAGSFIAALAVSWLLLFGDGHWINGKSAGDWNNPDGNGIYGRPYFGRALQSCC